MRTKEVLRILQEDGWIIRNQVGPHIHLIHKTKKGQVTVPSHSAEIKKGTANSILKQAGLK